MSTYTNGEHHVRFETWEWGDYNSIILSDEKKISKAPFNYWAVDICTTKLTFRKAHPTLRSVLKLRLLPQEPPAPDQDCDHLWTGETTTRTGKFYLSVLPDGVLSGGELHFPEAGCYGIRVVRINSKSAYELGKRLDEELDEARATLEERRVRFLEHSGHEKILVDMWRNKGNCSYSSAAEQSFNPERRIRSSDPALWPPQGKRRGPIKVKDKKS